MRKTTMIILGVCAAILAGYDVWMVMTPESGDTISEVIIDWSYKYPAFTFSCGFIAGHLWWQLRSKK